MKTSMIPFFCCGLMAFGLSSCKEEEELTAKEFELSDDLDSKRKRLNELVRKVDALETSDQSEKLVDVQLNLDRIARGIEFEKKEQANLAEEQKQYEKKLADYRGKYPLRIQ